MLTASGWLVQGDKQFNSAAGRGIDRREAPLKSGACDYLLRVDRTAVGVSEAEQQGTLFSGVALRSGPYAENLPEFTQSSTPGQLPFLYRSTSVEILVRDERDREPPSRRVFWCHRPATLAATLAQPETLRARGVWARRPARVPFSARSTVGGVEHKAPPGCVLGRITQGSDGFISNFAGKRSGRAVGRASGVVRVRRAWPRVAAVRGWRCPPGARGGYCPHRRGG